MQHHKEFWVITRPAYSPPTAERRENVRHLFEECIEKEEDHSICYGHAGGVAQIMDEGDDNVMEVVEDTAERKESAVSTESPPTQLRTMLTKNVSY